MSDSAYSPPGMDALSSAWNFSKLVPGLEFLQQWTKSAGAAMPAMGQWVAPTLDPAELEKRINDLRTVQFWLEHNARMIAMSIQALEVQRMTLNTLRGMNVPVDALKDTLKAQPSPATPAAAPQSPPAPSSPFTSAFASAFGIPPASASTAAPGASAPPAAPEAVVRPAHADPADSDDALPEAHEAEAETPAADQPGAGIDPMRWWGSLTQQFAQLATHAMQDALKDGPAAVQSATGVSPVARKPRPQAKPSAVKRAAPKKAAPPSGKVTAKAGPAPVARKSSGASKAAPPTKRGRVGSTTR